MMPKLRGLLGLLGMTAIVVGLPALLVAVADLGTPRLRWSLQGWWQALLSPDDGTLALTLIKLAGWLAWAILTGAIGVEVMARLRGRPVPRLPGLRLPQAFARRLVGAAAALFVATATGHLTAAPAIAGPAPTPAAHPQHLDAVPTEARAADAAPQQARSSHSLYRVKKGDTLSEIALKHTGKAANYPKIFKASRAITQPGGRHLVDPDMIDIGWTLRIPRASDTASPSKAADDPTPSKAESQSSTPTPTASTSPAPLPTEANPAPTSAAQPTTVDTGAEHEVAPDADGGWLLTGLAGAGALLAGSMLMAIRRRRALQFRNRRPGRSINVPPAEAAPVEKTIIRAGAPTAELVLFIDEALRRLAGHFLSRGQALPSLVGLEAETDRITLRLRRPAVLPAPFTAVDDQVWRLDLGSDLTGLAPLSPDGAAPWPQLVTLGADASGWRMVNLEALGVISLTGDPTYAADLARYLVAELALSPWARDVEIDCLAVCDELPGFAPARIRYHAGNDVIAEVVAAAVATAERLTSTEGASLDTARVGFAGDELWDSRVLVTAVTNADHLDTLTTLIADQPGRTATSVLLLTDQVDVIGLEFRLTTDGRLQLPALGLDVVVNGLTAAEARGCAAVLAAGDDLSEAAMPTGEAGAEWSALCDSAGALRSELTKPRGTSAHDGATSSLLPEADEVYVAGTANTAEDLMLLGPQVPLAVRQHVEAVDPQLDDDLAAWWADSTDRPRLSVLGEVKVRLGRTGNAVKAAARTGFATELVAYLHSRPHGATTEQVAGALGVSAERVRKDVSLVRGWLGINPATGQPFLPTASRTGKDRGSGVYQIDDLLCDADLFRRLRLRGEARGAEGVQDLQSALQLVHGTPYSGIRAKGGVWLADNPLDHHLLCAVVDVAHTVATIALHNGNLEQARNAAELAARVAPDETTPHLDLAAIANNAGDHKAAAAIARALVRGENTTADARGDLPERAEHVLRTHRWLGQEQAS